MNKLKKLICLCAAAVVVLQIAFSGTVTASAYAYYQTNTDTLMRIGKMYKTSSENCLAFSDGLNSTGDLGIHFYTNVNGVNYSILTATGKVFVTCDAKLSSSESRDRVSDTYGSKYSPYSLITSSTYTFENYEYYLNVLKSKLGVNVFPAVNGTKVYLCAGKFASEAEANAAISLYYQKTGVTFTPLLPNVNTVAVADLNTGDTLLKVVSSSSQALCAYPVQPNNDKAQKYYLNNHHNYSYEGVFEYKASSGGLAMVNIIPLEAYVRGVIPYEIYTSWGDEAIKAFAVTVRTFALSNMNKHTKDGFNLCDSSNCQVYRGLKKATERTNRLVAETSGKVITYNGKLIEAYYSDNGGGTTEDVSNIWGSDQSKYPYLKGVLIPEEMYFPSSNLEFSNLVTKSALSDYLMSKSNVKAKLSGGISNIEVINRTPSGYVYQLRLTDNYGKSMVITNGSNTKSVLSKYVKSSKFYIGLPIVELLNDGQSKENINSAEVKVITADGDSVRSEYLMDGAGLSTKVLTANGLRSLNYTTGSYLITGKGWGHGVGMTQEGINALSNLEYSYEDIIKRFYTGVSIVDHNTL
ncbi:MAG: SpoIID/LytB domain-containing protein [Firmicutes bacterium]|nr:SpoIID/LytB domain-containing protein [Bacillota bacterium]